MKIAFVIQRYGAEILGGSEYHCRLIAERLAERRAFQVEVLTTCARDYITWKNEYQEGADRVRGVTVRRFANARQRDIQTFNRYSDWIFNNPHDREAEMEWLRLQGPWAPTLQEYIERNHNSYDALVFFTYLYAPTVLGVQIAPSKSLLVPTAHDEPAIHLDLYKDVFSRPAAIAFNTESERRFLKETFSIRAAEETVGCGVDLLPHQTEPRDEDARLTHEDEESEQENDDRESGRHIRRPHLVARGATFRRRHRIHGPFALYGGRIDPGKGCEELLEYFHAYREQGGEASLVLMGAKLMTLPDAPFINFAGMLSEAERLHALEAATVVVVPSPYESLSLLALEAFAVGTPVLANARSEVLVDHCQRSNAGLYYADKDEFIEAMNLLMIDERLRGVLARNGREYVKRNYKWDVILAKYERLFTKIRERAR